MSAESKVLVVDGHLDILDATRTVLSTQPYRTSTARDGVECWEKWVPEVLDEAGCRHLRGHLPGVRALGG